MANTKHAATCKMAFGRKDNTCPRCIELLNGAPARSWGGQNVKADVSRSNEIASHFNSLKHRSGQCGVICTFGDY